MRRLAMLLVFTLVGGMFSPAVMAREGEMGAFGGISQGVPLPTSIDKYITNTNTKKRNTNTNLELGYKEMVFISGEPVELTGTLELRSRGGVEEDEPVGTYEETYTIEVQNVEKQIELERQITFQVSYQRTEDAKEISIVKNSRVEPGDWEETITIGGEDYELDETFSSFSKGIYERHTPGVNYYQGRISSTAIYQGEESGQSITVQTEGPIYGYEEPWSKTETQKLNVTVDAGEWQLGGEITPSVTTYKSIQYNKNPDSIKESPGIYSEIIDTNGVMRYSIFTNHLDWPEELKQGSMSLDSSNSFQMLRPATEGEYLRGHFAEDDIKRLYSMGIIDNLRYFQPNQVMTRGEYIKALCIAMDIPVEEVSTSTSRNTRNRNQSQQESPRFVDVPQSHPDYSYIMGAYNGKLIYGDGAYFYPEYSLTREEAFVILVRILGLERLGLDPTPRTPFVDDDNISNWAKREIYAANNIGLIRGDSMGKVNPKAPVSKGEAAALINRLIDYLREDIMEDYRSKMMY